MNLMAKKKPNSDKPKNEKSRDYHVSRKMVRLPPEIHRQFKILSERNDRPMSREIRTALIRHLRDAGLWPPEPA